MFEARGTTRTKGPFCCAPRPLLTHPPPSGEVCVRGPTVFQGYYKDEAQVGGGCVFPCFVVNPLCLCVGDPAL